MTESDFEEHLIAWGRLYGAGSGEVEERSLTGNSPLAAMIGKRKEPDRARYGFGRRKLMGEAAGLRGTLPAWATDPVTGTASRSFRPSTDDSRETPTLARIQAAWLALWRDSEARAQAVRLHYQERRLTREEKAKRLGMTVLAYREAVRCGKVAMYGSVHG